MIKQSNNEVLQFNSSRKNQKKINACRGYAFVSCPDFQHDGGKYNYATGLRSGMPLHISSKLSELKKLERKKPMQIFLSDHELRYDNLLKLIGDTYTNAKEKVTGSLREIRKEFPRARFLSDEYDYDFVLSLKSTVPQGKNLENEIANWGNENLSRQELEDRYLGRYAQVQAFMMLCEKNNLCAVFIYSIFIFKIVSLIRATLPIPVLFIETES